MPNSGRDGAGRRPTLACLHAHHVNIAALDGLFPPDAIDVVHYVDPGLLRRTAADPAFPPGAQAARVADQLDWIVASGCDAIVVTCTAYAALAAATAGPRRTPVVAVDAPLLAELATVRRPVVLAFTNPQTVGPTMRRLGRAIGDAGATVRPILIPDAFQLAIAGRADAYDAAVANALRAIAASAGGAVVAVAQLSMVGAARRAHGETGREILTPREPLTRRLADVLAVPVPGRG